MNVPIKEKIRNQKTQNGIVLTVSIVALAILWGIIKPVYFHNNWAHMETERMEFADDSRCVEFPNYGKISTGPSLTLSAGKYKLTWDVKTDADNVMNISCFNIASIRPTQVILKNGTGMCELEFLDDVYDLQFNIDFESGSYLEVSELSLEGNKNTDRLLMLSMVIIGATLLFLCRKRIDILTFILLAGAIGVACFPALKESLLLGDDSSFHIERLKNMLNAWKTGQFPSRVGGYMNFGYGSIVSVFYPDLFLIIPALLILLGASIPFALNTFAIVINILSGLFMLMTAKRITKDQNAARIAAVLYVLSFYRLSDLYARFAQGEVLAMTFLPLFILGLWETILGEQSYWKTLGVSAAAIFLSHYISALICGIIAASIILRYGKRIVQEKRIFSICKALSLAVLLSVWQIIPLLTSRNTVNTTMMMRQLSYFTISPHEVLELFPSSGKMYGLGILIILGSMIFAAIIICEKIVNQSSLGKAKCPEGLVTGFIIAWIMVGAATYLFPWDFFEYTCGLLILAYIQFPYRMLTWPSAILSICAGWAYTQIIPEKWRKTGVLVLSVCAVLLVSIMLQRTVQSYPWLGPGRISQMGMTYDDYTIRGSVSHMTTDTEVHADEGIETSDIQKWGTNIQMMVNADRDGALSVPLYAFEGYAAEIDGQALPIEYGENNRIQVNLKSGMQGYLKIYFAGNRIWMLGNLVSLAAAVILLLYGIRDGKERKLSISDSGKR